MTTKKILLPALLFMFMHTIMAQQFISRTLLHDGETREYQVYVPASYQANSPVPLLFNFHGGAGDIASQVFISDMRPIADTAGLILVYPQALPDLNNGGSTSWTHKEPTTVDDVFFVEAMIDALAAEYLIDENRVYACGYSNGGEFSFELACRLSQRIAAIGVVARSMFIETYNQCSPTHPMAVVTIHGSDDDYSGITFGGITYYVSLETVNTYWSNFNHTTSTPTVVTLPNLNNSDGSTVEHYAWNDGDACVSVEHFKVLGGGHDWPGSFGNMDIDASLEIWNFVSKYDLNGLIQCNTTSVNEWTEEGETLIHPNPVANHLTIEIKSAGDQSYHIYSAPGELLLSGEIGLDNKTIDVSALPANLYFLKVENQVLKFIKAK